jgi:hypothetical protein
MTEKEIIDYKKRLLQFCLNIIRERESSLILSIENAQAAANSEEKSSAGDKYETSRAMSHIEKDMYAKQLQSTRQELAGLMNTDCSPIYPTATKGSLVKCGDKNFFIAAGIGKILFEEQQVYVLSPQAPLAGALQGKKPGSQVIFNQESLLITSVA